MPDIDFFNFFRQLLSLVATVYATVVTLQSLWGWYVWLAGQDKYIGMVRRYIIVHGLRLRFLKFVGDLFVCILLCVVFIMLWHAHQLVHELKLAMN
ncbi:MAG TPA: hypothetical protein VHD56_00185 [Tepidisphaeraceae bacterium]|nr:hypothetical protein [Tepidisphaeraceae bacterium]